MATVRERALEEIVEITKTIIFKIKTQQTSLHPRIEYSLNCRKSSIRIFMRRNLSEKPTNMYKPEGCNAMLYASSASSL